MNRLSLSRYLPIVLLSVIFLPVARVSAANPPAGGDVLINEYVANSSVTEWVELYNTTASDLDLSGHYLDDLQNAGGAPKLIPNGTIIPAGG